ncbi:DICT sensory domain-containing protein [Haloarcula litorea]|uniref:DICT sensory domain-containing protein n=1 Tax=Haloarcula litorea TaxID=3032579 RepID=UPI0023E89676|nr:DICT sensory domain-containing protein [Halomicroarcula sp. GDY20]
MSLSELVSGVERHEKTLTVFNADEPVAADLRDRFANRNVTVRTERTASGRPGEFVTLSEDGDVLTATDLSSLRESLDGDRGAPPVDGLYRPILDSLDETMFTSWDIEQMVTASREIEDRALRVDAGELHAGFQTLSTLRGERERYDHLGESGVEVHAYAVPDVDPPGDHTFTLHLERAEEIANSWFVAFDGGGDPAQKCALLAEEREPRTFYGFWTYDGTTVDWIVDHLRTTYGFLEQ